MTSCAFAHSSLPCHWPGQMRFAADGAPILRYKHSPSRRRRWLARPAEWRAELGDESSPQALDTREEAAKTDADRGTSQPQEETYDPVAARVRQELLEQGINMDDLLDAGKVVSLTRELDELTAKLEAREESENDAELLERKAAVVRAKLVAGKRQVMQRWLKQLFLAQAGVFVVVGGLLASDHFPGVPDVPLVGQALGFWMTWLFVIPSLRARKGLPKAEKSALNIAFVSSPLVNLALPFVTKDCGAIWVLGIIVLAAAYARYGVLPGLSPESFASVPSEDGHKEDNDESADDSAGIATRERGRIKGILKFLDWGSWR